MIMDVIIKSHIRELEIGSAAPAVAGREIQE